LTCVKESFRLTDYAWGMKEKPLLMADREQVIDLPGETQFTPNGIVSRTLFATPDTRVVLFGFSPGQELTEHTSTKRALVQILSGECEFTLNGKPRKLRAGDLLHMPPNLPHGVIATKQFSMLLTLTRPDGKSAPKNSDN